ncbi:class I lanthipeptide [Pontibacter litorisediminis]|uniref:class I lanthipeptide n=1 Tax=Pontibacter litorisediminis TaxID=1846260 RepID=UPI003B847687
MKSIKKLSLKKTVVAKLNNDQLEGIVGGYVAAATGTCSANCATKESTITLCVAIPDCTKGCPC